MPIVPFSELIQSALAGQPVSFPTDTVPALAIRPDRAEQIFQVKQRSQEKPLILMGAKAEDLWPYTHGTPTERQIWQSIAHQYWPGALTLVLPASSQVPPAVNPLTPTTIGIRVPQHPIACAILAQTGVLATTSVNRSGQPPLQDLSQIALEFPNLVVLDPQELERWNPPHPPNPSSEGTPSTVVRWQGNGWEILRAGAIPWTSEADQQLSS